MSPTKIKLAKAEKARLRELKKVQRSELEKMREQQNAAIAKVRLPTRAKHERDLTFFLFFSSMSVAFSRARSLSRPNQGEAGRGEGTCTECLRTPRFTSRARSIRPPASLVGCGHHVSPNHARDRFVTSPRASPRAPTHPVPAKVPSPETSNGARLNGRPTIFPPPILREKAKKNPCFYHFPHPPNPRDEDDDKTE